MRINSDKDNKENCPSGLTGKWKAVNTGETMEITGQCLYYLIGTYPYSFPDPNTLHYGRDTFYQRVSGNPGFLIGMWRNEEIGEELIFREDGTYSSKWTGGEAYSGTYTATETLITTSEMRATLKTDGSNITWSKADDGSVFHGTFEIVSSEKWILRLGGMEEIIYTRV
ncbi:MAG: hypothetical protein P794_05000 [Epsilonproteobacteria bacterium (ex Lamellibrachia satsuma)]|nr:MAG: hypothetical protein P794_05000 [Epsilonproteobacteria bacterium (ex Lamellibrachia satsuma)]